MMNPHFIESFLTYTNYEEYRIYDSLSPQMLRVSPGEQPNHDSKECTHE